jgi:hypothetical protein
MFAVRSHVGWKDQKHSRWEVIDSLLIREKNSPNEAVRI